MAAVVGSRSEAGRSERGIILASRVIYSKNSRDGHEVWLKVSSHVWSALAPSVKRSFSNSLEVLAGLRTEIANDSPVKWMPFIEVSAELWRIPGGKAHGQATTIEHDGGRHFGVRIPAQTALCEDHQVVRAALVHEFNHCFFNIQTALAKAFPGEYPSSELPDFHDPSDPVKDELRMVDQYSWFGRGDADVFMKDGDSRSQVLNATFETLTKYLRQIDPEATWPKGKVDIPLEVVSHIKRLLLPAPTVALEGATEGATAIETGDSSPSVHIVALTSR
jgi:hypothetical protein